MSEDQITVARSACSGLSAVELRVASALDLPYSAESFDAVASIQVLEYIDDVDRALRELRRVLKPAGRFVNLATNWDAVFWNSRSPDRAATLSRRLAQTCAFSQSARRIASALGGR